MHVTDCTTRCAVYVPCITPCLHLACYRLYNKMCGVCSLYNPMPTFCMLQTVQQEVWCMFLVYPYAYIMHVTDGPTRCVVYVPCITSCLHLACYRQSNKMCGVCSLYNPIPTSCKLQTVQQDVWCMFPV